MKDINKKISLINFTDSNREKTQIKWLVIHYVGAVSTAKNNANYFYSTYRGASAHFFVDENEIWQVVEENDTAWHCGASKYYSDCRNSNSIGIEMCVKNDGQWYFEKETVQNTIELVKYLCEKYNIDRNHVIRHYDVTHKVCPEPYVRNENAWESFKDAIFGENTITEPSQPTETKGYTVKIDTAVLNVREEANTNSKIKTQVKKGEVYTIIEEQNNWGKLKSGAGWICLDYVEKTSASIIPSEKTEKTMRVDAKIGLNVRNKPNGKIVGTLADKTIVTVYEEKNKWSRIGDNRWVSSEYLEAVEKTENKQKTFKKGDIVKIKSSAEKYVTGQKIPSYYKKQAYTIMEKTEGKSLLKQIMSWVYDKDLTK